MKSRLEIFTALTIFVLLGTMGLMADVSANSRTLEFPFKVSADLGSEFRVRPPVVSGGFIIVEARWTHVGDSRPARLQPSSLSLSLLRPDGTEAAQRSGKSPLGLEYRVAEEEVSGSPVAGVSGWTVKLVNDEDVDRADVEGRLRITVPLSTRVLVDTQFTLLASGNAQELSFAVAKPGRLVMEADWSTDPLSGAQPPQIPLSLMLIHPGQDKTYARRQGPSPLRVERQITEQEVDRGLRWVARIQNDGRAKVRGVLKVTFTPAL